MKFYIKIIICALFPQSVAITKDVENIDEINQKRKEVAKNWNIAGMTDLEYDKELAEKVASLECDDLDHGPNYRYFMIASNAAAKEEELKEVETFFKYRMQGELETAFSWLNSTTAEVLVPSQRKIGCALKDCYRENDGNKLEYDTACLVGPHGTISASDFQIHSVSGKKSSSVSSGSSEDQKSSGCQPTFIITFFFLFLLNL